MKKVLAIIICFISISVFSQVSIIGYSQPFCTQPMSTVYTYSNYVSGQTSSLYASFRIFRNGTPVFSYFSGGHGVSSNQGTQCYGMFFINDSTGFVVDKPMSGPFRVYKTTNYGVNFDFMGMSYASYLDLYPVNANYVYMITGVGVSRYSDIEPPQVNFIYDSYFNTDLYVMDTALYNPLCNIDSLDITIKHNTDTITYHLNGTIPICEVYNAIPSICPGKPINVPFSVGAMFNPGNIFTAQLSDANGSFANPVNLGSLASTNAGIISAVIPSTITMGTNYKIRVVSSDPVYYGTGNGAQITTITNLPALTILGSLNSVQSLNPVGTNSICIGGHAYLIASGATTYTWSNGSTSSIYATSTITPAVTTTYSVIGENACGVSYDSLVIDVHSSPVITFSNTTVCAGASTLLTAMGAVSYTWSTGSTSPGISVNSNTTYTVTGDNNLGCGTSTQTISVAVITMPVLTFPGANSVCNGSSAVLNVLGATTYTWDNGVSASSITVSPVANTIYTVSGENACGISSQTLAVTVLNTLPALSISGPGSVCVNSSVNLIGSGATTYTWNTGTTSPNLNDMPFANTTYTLLGENACGISTETFSVLVDNTCANVWPGDANSDGVVNNLDILELGLHYMQAGPPRASTSNNWQSYFSNNWLGTITNGKNLNHSDCNGDGIISASDTLAIYNNYGSSHSFKPANVSGAPYVIMVGDQHSVHKNSWGSASVYLGDSSSYVTNINGLAMTLTFEDQYIDTDSIYVEYIPSFLNALNQNLNFQKLDFSNGKTYTATTHTVCRNASGFGKIAVVHFKINPQLSNTQYLHITPIAVYKSDSAGTISPINVFPWSGAQIVALSSFVGINEISNTSSVSLMPNPTNGLISINSSNEIQTIEVSSIAGHILISQPGTGKKEELQLQALSNGVYFVKVTLADGRNAVKKIVVNH